MADDCTSCGEDLGGVYQYYWGLPYHPECCPANIAEARERACQRRIGRDEAARATPPASVVEAMERALWEELEAAARDVDTETIRPTSDLGFDVQVGRVIAAKARLRAALAALTAWRDAQ